MISLFKFTLKKFKLNSIFKNIFQPTQNIKIINTPKSILSQYLKSLIFYILSIPKYMPHMTCEIANCDRFKFKITKQENRLHESSVIARLKYTTQQT